MTTSEGPATLPWDEKVERMVDILRAAFGRAFDENEPDFARIAESLLVSIGDANA